MFVSWSSSAWSSAFRCEVELDMTETRNASRSMLSTPLLLTSAIPAISLQ